MILNIYRLVAPDKIDPGMVIDTDRGPLLVDEVRRTLDGVVASGHLVNGNGKRRAHIPLPATVDVAVLPAPDVEARVWSHVVDGIRQGVAKWLGDHDEAGERLSPEMAPWTATRDTVIVRAVDGVKGEFWLEVPPLPAAPVPADAEPF